MLHTVNLCIQVHFRFLISALFLGLIGIYPVTAVAQKSSAAQSDNTALSTKRKPMVKLTTTFGTITLELDANKAPKTVENFLDYVKSGHYDGTIFHRVIDGFMIQGGGFTSGMQQKPTKPAIENEANNGLKNDKYTIAMARTNDPQSATAQFFINVANNEFLNFSQPTNTGWGYCVFGKVIEGEDVVDKIRAVATSRSGMFSDVPKEDVVIEKAEIL